MIIHHLPHLSQKKIILGSKSPRRAEILKQLGLTFHVEKSGFAEDLPKSSYIDAAAYAIATAEQKAREVARRNNDVDLVIGADTIVVLNGDILEKPESEGDAVRMLRLLSGQQHTVVSAVCLVSEKNNGFVKTFHVSTKVWFDELCDDSIHAYVKSGEPMDKAGAYGIQGAGASFVKHIDGCYYTVMGLPVHALARELQQLVDDDLL